MCSLLLNISKMYVNPRRPCRHRFSKNNLHTSTSNYSASPTIYSVDMPPPTSSCRCLSVRASTTPGISSMVPHHPMPAQPSEPHPRMHSTRCSASLSALLHRTLLTPRTPRTGLTRRPTGTRACAPCPASCCSSSRTFATISLRCAPLRSPPRFLLTQVNTTGPLPHTHTLDINTSTSNPQPH